MSALLAIVKQVSEDERKLYLIRETKGTKDQLRLRVGEGAKIYCDQISRFVEIKIMARSHISSRLTSLANSWGS